MQALTRKIGAAKDGAMTVGVGNLPDIGASRTRNTSFDQAEHGEDNELRQSAQSHRRGQSEVAATGLAGTNLQDLLRARLREMVDAEVDRVQRSLLRKTSKDEIPRSQRQKVA